MKTLRTLFFLLLASLPFTGQAQEPIYIFFYADVEASGENYRYFSTIIDKPANFNKDCLILKAQESLKVKAGDGAKIGTVEFERSGSFEDAENLILNKYTLPDRKIAYFKIDTDC